MGGEPGDRDLRETTPSQHGAYRPWLNLKREGSQSPPRDWDSLGYTEVVEERGLVGNRIVAKIIDYFVWSIAASVLLAPVYFIWFFANISTFETLGSRTDPEEFPWDFFASFFIVWGLMFGLMLVVSVLYYFISEHKFQQTVGKKAFELKVLSSDGQRASRGQLLARAVLYTMSLMFYFWIVELIVVATGVNNRSVTDRITGTKVVRARKIYHYPQVPGGGRPFGPR